MTFNEIPVGAKFRFERHGKKKWTKVVPVRFPKGHIQYNAISGDGAKIKSGHSAKVVIVE